MTRSLNKPIAEVGKPFLWEKRPMAAFIPGSAPEEEQPGYGRG